MNLPRPDKASMPKPKDFFEKHLADMDAEVRGMRILKYRMEVHTKGIETLLQRKQEIDMKLYTAIKQDKFFDEKQMFEISKPEKLVKLAKLTTELNNLISDLKEIESQFVEYYVVFDKMKIE